jgi:anthranilate phosphoribosyltransferase
MSDIQEAIAQLLNHEDLDAAATEAAMAEIMRGEAPDAQIGAFLAALRMKGETLEEITGCATAMRNAALPVRAETGGATVIDIVGTGGDGTHKFNISTIASFVVAGSGQKVAKHGNRSNRRAGSADVLEALGAQLQSTPEQAAMALEEVGIAFLFAPSYHQAMRFAMGPRRELRERTIFNILGPLTNPANPTNLLVGVFAPELTETMAGVLDNMGARAAYVVHGYYETGAGLDELTTTGVSRVSHLKDGAVTTFEFDPTELGFARATLADMQGGDAAENAAIARAILAGELTGPKRDVVLLNAAAALSTESGDFAAGLAAAEESLDSGAAADVLARFVEVTGRFGG